MLLAVIGNTLMTDRMRSTDVYHQRNLCSIAPKETITHHFFVSGIRQKKTVDAAKICGGAENVVKTETQQTHS